MRGTWINTPSDKDGVIVIPTRVIGRKLALGYKLMMLTGGASVISLLLVIDSLFSSVPYTTTKFAFFLTLLFGGLALELLWTKKLHESNE